MNMPNKNRIILIAISLVVIILIGTNIYFLNELEISKSRFINVSSINKGLEEENDHLNEHLIESVNKSQELSNEIDHNMEQIEVFEKNEFELKNQISNLNDQLVSKNDSSSQVNADPYNFIDLDADSIGEFDLEERYILNRWNQLSMTETTLGFWGINIGDNIRSVLGHSDNYKSYYRFAEENAGEEGLEISINNMDVFFIGTRVKSIFVHYYAGTDARYKVNDFDILYTLIEEDYSNYKVERIDYIIVVSDDINDTKMQFIYFDDTLEILIEHTERFTMD